MLGVLGGLGRNGLGYGGLKFFKFGVQDLGFQNVPDFKLFEVVAVCSFSRSVWRLAGFQGSLFDWAYGFISSVVFVVASSL